MKKKEDILKKSYKILFGKEPNNLDDWQIAKAVINDFNVKELGDNLSKEVIFEIVNHTNFPNSEITREIVGKTEGMATELFDELKYTNEPHMAEIEYLEWKRNFKK